MKVMIQHFITSHLKKTKHTCFKYKLVLLLFFTVDRKVIAMPLTFSFINCIVLYSIVNK